MKHLVGPSGFILGIRGRDLRKKLTLFGIFNKYIWGLNPLPSTIKSKEKRNC